MNRPTEPSDTNLAGRTVLVTGASSGIGEAVARRLASAGMRLVVCARRQVRLEALAEELRRWHPASDPLAVPCDLRDPEAIAAMFEQIERERGGVDVLVNNAGLGRKAPLIGGEPEAWREMLEVNVLALCICTSTAVTQMQAKGNRGHVVHIASMASHRVPAESGVYSATKFAVRSLTEGLRRELRAQDSGIRVSAISPGFVETEFAEVYAPNDPEAAKRTYARYPCLQPADIADAVEFVLRSPPHMQVHDILVRPTQQPD